MHRSFSLNPIGQSYPCLGKMHCIRLIYWKCLVCYCWVVEYNLSAYNYK